MISEPTQFALRTGMGLTLIGASVALFFRGEWRVGVVALLMGLGLAAPLASLNGWPGSEIYETYALLPGIIAVLVWVYTERRSRSSANTPSESR